MIRALLLIAATALTIACSASTNVSDSRQGSPAPVAPSAPAAPPTTGGGQPGAGQSLDACALLPDAEIEAITGRSIASRAPGPVQGIFSNGCTWEMEPGTGDMLGWSIDLGVLSPGGRQYFDRYLAPYAEGPLPGLGDAAVSQEVGGIDAVKGDTLVSVFAIVSSSANEDELTRELVQAALAHVP